jgi:hypothetical protein
MIPIYPRRGCVRTIFTENPALVIGGSGRSPRHAFLSHMYFMCPMNTCKHNHVCEYVKAASRSPGSDLCSDINIFTYECSCVTIAILTQHLTDICEMIKHCMKCLCMARTALHHVLPSSSSVCPTRMCLTLLLKTDYEGQDVEP